MNIRIALAAGTVLLLMTSAANASLTSVDGGLGVYDSSVNLTWTSDANLFGTQVAANPNVITTIIGDAAGLTALNGYNLTANDFSGDGTMTWQGSVAWVNYLNTTRYGGSSQWLLPSTVDSASSAGYAPPSSSQMAQLFYGSLGAVAGSPSWAQNSVFTHTQDSVYWSGTTIADTPGGVWLFDASTGFQNGSYTPYDHYALAVSVGQLSSVPLPAAAWLLLSGLGGFGVFTRKQRGG